MFLISISCVIMLGENFIFRGKSWEIWNHLERLLRRRGVLRSASLGLPCKPPSMSPFLTWFVYPMVCICICLYLYLLGIAWPSLQTTIPSMSPIFNPTYFVVYPIEMPLWYCYHFLVFHDSKLTKKNLFTWSGLRLIFRKVKRDKMAQV